MESNDLCTSLPGYFWAGFLRVFIDILLIINSLNCAALHSRADFCPFKFHPKKSETLTNPVCKNLHLILGILNLS
jgi:hypothetical protein